MKKLGLLPQILIAVALGILCSNFFPLVVTRIFATFNSIFSNFLGFAIPLIVLGLVAPSIADLGKGAGRLLGATVAIAYGSTIFAGFFSYFSCRWSFSHLLSQSDLLHNLDEVASTSVSPFFTVDMPPVMGVISALILAFMLGMGMSAIEGTRLKEGMCDLRDIITIVISKVIIPLLPIYIFGVFLIIGTEGKIGSMLGLFLRVIAFIFLLHALLLLIQFCVSGAICRKNPLRALANMMPAYMTALGTQSSAATIPVTLAQTQKNGVSDEVAKFVVPLCATIHLSGSILKIVACALAIAWMSGMPYDLGLFAGFIFMLGITMVAAPGVPGGAIMAALALLSSMLGFDESMQALMIALYITMDSFGTAGNVTGDGAIAMVVDRIYKRK